MDDEDEEGESEYDEDQDVVRVDATKEVDESLLVSPSHAANSMQSCSTPLHAWP